MTDIAPVLFGDPGDLRENDEYSNFWLFPRQVYFYGHLFWHTEGIFQWLKNPSDLALLLACQERDPMSAKRAGRKTTLRPDWNDVRFHCMQEALHTKVLNFPELLVKLLATGYAEIHENRPDRVWGGGPNYPHYADLLGHCWVQVRAYFRILLCRGDSETEHGWVKELQSRYPVEKSSDPFAGMVRV